MPTSSTFGTPVVRSSPLFVQSLNTPPAPSEAFQYNMTRQSLKDETLAVSTSDHKASRRALQLKTTKQKPSRSGNFSTIGGNSKTHDPSSSPSSRFKTSTTSPRSTSQTSKSQTVPAETLKNVARSTAPISGPQRQVLERQKLDPENWTLVTAKVTESTPAPRMKIHRYRRAAILSKDGTTSLFDSVQSPPNQKYKDVPLYKKCKSPSSLSHIDSEALSPHTPPPQTLTRDSSPKPAPKPRRTRSALSLPSSHLERRTRVVSKSVTWDPSIASDGLEARSTSEEARKEIQEKRAPEQVSSHKLDVEDCVEAIKKWGKTDRPKLVPLINALKQLGMNSEDLGRGDGNIMSSNDHRGEVLITTVKSMDPRVPDFEWSRNVDAKNKTDRVGKAENHLSAGRNLNPFDEPGYNKENIPDITLQLPIGSQNNEVPRIKKRITILDDYKSAGREVDSFADWYAEMQLREFAKKYPLTGRRLSAVQQAASMFAKVANHSESIRSVSGGSNVTRKPLRGGMKRDGEVSDLRNVERTATRGKDCAVAHNGSGYSSIKREQMRPRRRNMPYMNDPLARENAAVIQQRLEVLLLKQKERKALEGLPEMAKRPTGYVEYGAMISATNPYCGRLSYDESSPMSASPWIPSERLKLKNAWL